MGIGNHWHTILHTYMIWSLKYSMYRHKYQCLWAEHTSDSLKNSYYLITNFNITFSYLYLQCSISDTQAVMLGGCGGANMVSDLT